MDDNFYKCSKCGRFIPTFSSCPWCEPELCVNIDVLMFMFGLQSGFQEKYNDRFHFTLHRVASAIMTEGGELWMASKGKWWSKKNHNKEEQIGELVDILHFFLVYMWKRGINCNELYEAYLKKLAENYRRQESGTY